MSMQRFEVWKKGAESKRDIRTTLLDRCTQQVRKALLAAHPVEEIESLECRVIDFITLMRKAAQDPSMSTYMRKSKAMADYTPAKQLLSETEEPWAERVERLVIAIEATGGVKLLIVIVIVIVSHGQETLLQLSTFRVAVVCVDGWKADSHVLGPIPVHLRSLATHLELPFSPKSRIA